MSLSVELRSNIVVFRFDSESESFMADMLKAGPCTTTSPDGKTVVVVYNNEEEAKSFYDTVGRIIKVAMENNK